MTTLTNQVDPHQNDPNGNGWAVQQISSRGAH